MRNTYKVLAEKYELLYEAGLEPEQKMFNDPDNGLEIEVDDEDPTSGTLHYMGFEFPVSKLNKAGTIQYMIGNVANGRVIPAKDPTQFTKVLAAIDRGEIKPSTKSASSMFSKVQRIQPGEMVPVYYINPKDPRGEYIEKMREYMTNPQAEKYILDMYRKHGQKIFLKGDEGKAYNPLYGYATDNANHKDRYSQYWDLTRWMSKMNFADFRGGHKGANIIGHRTAE